MSLFGKLSGTSDAIGIDIGSHLIKVVQVMRTRNGFVLARAGSTPTPPEAIKQGVVDDRLAVAEAVGTLLHTLGIASPMAVAAVAGPSVIVRQVQLPEMSEHQLRKSIHWEARNYISFPVEDSLLEFQILGKDFSSGTPQMDVMLVATPRDMVDSRVDALTHAGLEPIAVELEPFALMRATLEAEGANQETVALVELGATYTHISIVANSQFVLSRSITIAGNSFTEAIASALGLEAAQADEVKENDVRVVMSESERAQLSPVGQEASRALDPLMEELVREIRRSFAFYDYQQGPATGAARVAEGVSRVLLTGGSARLGGLDAYLQEQLSLPVVCANPLSNGIVQLPAEGAEHLVAQGTLLATALGLALREPMLAGEKGGVR